MICLNCSPSSSPSSSDLPSRAHAHAHAHLSPKLHLNRPLLLHGGSSSIDPLPHHHHSATRAEPPPQPQQHGRREPSPPLLLPHLAFVYGTLKQGFGNHWLMEELMASRHARFLGAGLTARKFPLVCGPFQVPFLLHTPSPSGHHVRGEIYEIDDFALSRLDDLEGITKGHYERKQIDVMMTTTTAATMGGDDGAAADGSGGYGDSSLGFDDAITLDDSGCCIVDDDDDEEEQGDGGDGDSKLGYGVAAALESDDCGADGSQDSSLDAIAKGLDDDDDGDGDGDGGAFAIEERRRRDLAVVEDVPRSLGDGANAIAKITSSSTSTTRSVQVSAHAYFACQSYAHQMASCAPYIECYTVEEASAYVRRKDRPANRTFLEHVYAWMEEASLFHSSSSQTTKH